MRKQAENCNDEKLSHCENTKSDWGRGKFFFSNICQPSQLISLVYKSDMIIITLFQTKKVSNKPVLHLC